MADCEAGIGFLPREGAFPPSLMDQCHFIARHRRQVVVQDLWVCPFFQQRSYVMAVALLVQKAEGTPAFGLVSPCPNPTQFL